MSGSGQRKKKRDWVTGLHHHSFAFVGSRAGTDTNELSIKWLQSQDLAGVEGADVFIYILYYYNTI